MTVYGITALWLAVFYAALAIAAFFIANRFGKEEWFNYRRAAYLVGMLFLSLSLLLIPAFTIDAVENGSDPPCEWLTNITTSNETTTPIDANASNYGEMYHYNAAGTTVTIAVLNTWYEVLVYQAGNLNNVTFDSGNDTLIVEEGDIYSIDWSMSFSGGSSDEYVISPFLNNVTEITRCTQHRKLGTGGDVGSASGSCLISLADDDVIGLKIKNLDAAADAVVDATNVNVRQQLGSLASQGAEVVTLTNHTYYNTCDGVAAPGYVEKVFVIQTWLIWVLMFALFLGVLIYSIKVLGARFL